jgi:hypothetical protein
MFTILLTSVDSYHVDNHLDQGQGIRRDKVVAKMDKKFESPKLKINIVLM